MEKKYTGLEGTLTLLKYMSPNDVQNTYYEFMTLYFTKTWESKDVSALWTRMIRRFDYHQPKKARGRIANNCYLLKDNDYTNKDVYNYLTSRENHEELKEVIKELRGK